jgi:multidrug efflux pump subunit AcrB
VPMAITIMFGLAFATALTLLVVPVLYSLFFRVSLDRP